MVIFTGIEEFDRLNPADQWQVLSHIPGTTANIELCKQIYTACLFEASRLNALMNELFALQAAQNAKMRAMSDYQPKNTQPILAEPVLLKLEEALDKTDNAKLLPHLIFLHSQLAEVVANYCREIDATLARDPVLAAHLERASANSIYSLHYSVATAGANGLSAENAIPLDSLLLPEFVLPRRYREATNKRPAPVVALCVDEQENVLHRVARFRESLQPHFRDVSLEEDVQHAVEEALFQFGVALDCRNLLLDSVSNPMLFADHITLMLSYAPHIVRLQRGLQIGLTGLGEASQPLFAEQNQLDTFHNMHELLRPGQSMVNNVLFARYADRMGIPSRMAFNAIDAAKPVPASRPSMLIQAG